MFDGKFWLQIIVAHTVAGYTLNKMLWETYKTYTKQKARKGLLKLNWTGVGLKQLFGLTKNSSK